MEYVFLGQTGVRVSKLVMGTMEFGGTADKAASAAMFARARDAGINMFDCADVYNGGASEEILGELMAGCREEILVASKVYFATSQGPNSRGSSRLHLMRAVEACLKRLGTDRLDFLFLHRFDDVTATEETWRAVDDLVSQGKIVYPAFSNFSAWQSMKVVEQARQRGWAMPVAVQPMYNLVKRQAEVEILPMAQAEALAVFPYSPTGGGLLSGRYQANGLPPGGRLVDSAMYRTRYGDPAYLEAATAFCDLARDISVHPVSLAVAWVAAHPAVTAPIIGGRSVEQITPALAALAVDMNDELRRRISALWPAPPPATDRNEEASADNYGTR